MYKFWVLKVTLRSNSRQDQSTTGVRDVNRKLFEHYNHNSSDEASGRGKSMSRLEGVSERQRIISVRSGGERRHSHHTLENRKGLSSASMRCLPSSSCRSPSMVVTVEDRTNRRREPQRKKTQLRKISLPAKKLSDAADLNRSLSLHPYIHRMRPRSEPQIPGEMAGACSNVDSLDKILPIKENSESARDLQKEKCNPAKIT